MLSGNLLFTITGSPQASGGLGVLVLDIVIIVEEVQEENSGEEGGLHFRQAARREVDDEAVAPGHVGHVGGRLPNPSHLLPLNAADDKAGLGKAKDVESYNWDNPRSLMIYMVLMMPVWSSRW